MTHSVFMIRNNLNGLYKRKRAGRTTWIEDGDTYATLGIAKSAMAGIEKCHKDLVGHLEIVAFDLSERGYVNHLLGILQNWYICSTCGKDKDECSCK